MPNDQASLRLFLDACGGAVRQNGKETVCHCPAHEDENPSLNVRVGSSGKLLVKCRAGCENTAIVQAIGWTLQDFMPSRPGKNGQASRPKGKKKRKTASYPTVEAIGEAAAKWKKGSLESIHIYRDQQGQPVFGVVHIRHADGSKEVPQIRAEAGNWVFGGIKVDRPPYLLPELLAAPTDTAVLMFEGEQKADLAASLGFVATSCSQGAGKAGLTDLAPLAGHVLHVLADNDSAGLEHMKDVAARAYAVGVTSVHLVELPDLPPKGDIVDFVNALREAGLDDGQIADEIRDAIAKATQITQQSVDDDTDAEPAHAADDGDETPAKIADQLVGLAAGATLFHDEDDEPYATIQVDEHRETWRIGSAHFERWLRSQYYRTFGKAVPPASMTTAIGQLTAMAQFDGERQSVHTRVARVEGALWLDLCNDEWQAVEITAPGWRVVSTPPVCFTRKPGMKALSAPASGMTSLDPLFDLLHFTDTDLRLLVTTWVANSLMSGTSYPILALTGEQGSGKTTFSRALQRLIDPHGMEGRSPPRSEEDIAVAAQHAHLLVYENLSGISAQLSDSLCRVATGAGFAARKLYTDSDERQLQFCRPIIINGIDDLATRSDLADRVISVQLQPIPGGQRRTETDLWAAFEEMQPRLLGALLDLVVKVLSTGDVNVPLERMAEYSRLGAKVAMALGLEPTVFSDAYQANRDAASLTALESSAVGPVLIRIVATGPFNGLISGLLHELQHKASKYEQRHPNWPATPRALGGELRRLSPNLARIGVTVRFLGHRRDGYWVAVEEIAAADGHNGHNDHAESQAT